MSLQVYTVLTVPGSKLAFGEGGLPVCMNDCKKKKTFIEIYECIFLLLLVILQTALLELKQHKETKLVKKCNNCITILDRGEWNSGHCS